MENDKLSETLGFLKSTDNSLGNIISMVDSISKNLSDEDKELLNKELEKSDIKAKIKEATEASKKANSILKDIKL